MQLQKYLLLVFLLLHILSANAGTDTPTPIPKPSWIKRCKFRLHQIITEGNNDLFLSGYSWHNRFAYTQERIKHFNELAFGGGFGKGVFDARGNWHGLSAVAFLDSHKNIEPVVGYTYLRMAHFENEKSLGIGYSIAATRRPELYHGRPFPGLLPWISASYHQATLMATYIPGFSNVGNVLFVIGKWTFH